MGEKDRSKLFLSIVCSYLVIIVCVQLFIIYTLKVEVSHIRQQYENSKLLCGKKHATTTTNATLADNGRWKRFARSLSTCPPGCIRRKRRRLGFTGGRPEETTVLPTASSVYSNNEWHNSYGYHDDYSYDRTGLQGAPGEPGSPGLPGGRGLPGGQGLAGQPGAPGLPGGRGNSGGQGLAGEPGAPGLPGGRGLPGRAGLPGSPGRAGEPGARGLPGNRGLTGRPGLPGRAGEPGSQGMPGFSGRPGQQGRMGLQGERGSTGPMGPPGERGYTDESYNYNPQLKSRGDQGNPPEDPTAYDIAARQPKNQTQMSEVLKELRLLDHPECKDEVNHKALMQDLKNKGKMSFMIIVDLEDSIYCIVHA